MSNREIWDYLISKTKNPFGAAAIMGNLMAESSMNPLCATGKNRTANYAKDADNGGVDFVNDGVAFGLVQWCNSSRKEKLLNYVKSKGKSVGDASVQTEYLVVEMSQYYKTAWNAVLNATDIRTASDVVMLKYEKPGTTTEAAKKKRAAYGQKFYDQFAGGAKPVPDPKTKTVTATANVNIRNGNGKEYKRLGLLQKGETLPWVATSEDNWHAVKWNNQVVWVSGEFSKV